MYRFLALPLAAALLLPAGGALDAQPPAAPDTALSALLPVNTALVHGTLANGVRYFVLRNGRPESRAELRLVVDVGSVLEDDDQLGLAHFVEHMAFNGTRNFPKNELVHYLESIGMRFGADLNAYTSFDETVYMLTVPTDSARLLPRGIEILADWAVGLTFDSAEIERERGVVIEEWRSGRGTGRRISDQQPRRALHRMAHLGPAIERPTDLEDGQHQRDEDRRHQRGLQRGRAIAVLQEARGHRVRTFWLAFSVAVSPPKPV